MFYQENKLKGLNITKLSIQVYFFKALKS
jgi:hypothetical protein